MRGPQANWWYARGLYPRKITSRVRFLGGLYENMEIIRKTNEGIFGYANQSTSRNRSYETCRSESYGAFWMSSMWALARSAQNGLHRTQIRGLDFFHMMRYSYYHMDTQIKGYTAQADNQEPTKAHERWGRNV